MDGLVGKTVELREWVGASRFVSKADCAQLVMSVSSSGAVLLGEDWRERPHAFVPAHPVICGGAVATATP